MIILKNNKSKHNYFNGQKKNLNKHFKQSAKDQNEKPHNYFLEIPFFQEWGQIEY